MLLYTTDVINEANAAAVGQVMAETLRDDLSLHDAWELVEEFTATNIQWYVFKCLATESGLTDDYFVVMGRTIATGELRFGLCEDYDSSTNTMSHMAHGFTGSQYAMDALGRSPHTFVLSTSNLSGGGGGPWYQQWIPSGTNTKWWLIASEEGFTIAWNGAANGFVHVGSYIPLTPLPIDLPLQIIGHSSSIGSITRNPSAASITIYDYCLALDGGGSTNLTGVMLGLRGSLKNNDRLQSNQCPVAEQGMVIYQFSSNVEPLIGWALGKQKRMRVGKDSSSPTAFAWGDAYALDGTLWVPYKPDDVRIWDTGVAV